MKALPVRVRIIYKDIRIIRLPRLSFLLQECRTDDCNALSPHVTLTRLPLTVILSCAGSTTDQFP